MIGHPCNDCETGIYKLSQKGKVYCSEKCWLGDTKASVSPQSTPERSFDPSQVDFDRRLGELELYRANMKPYLERLVDEIKSLRILVEEVAGKQATDLHVSLKNHDIRESKTPSLEEAAKIVESHKEEIPVINDVPEGFETKN